MFFEIEELIKMVTTGAFYYLPIHLIAFVLMPLLIRYFYGKGYKPHNSLKSAKVSVIIPEYGENIGIFEKCVSSIAASKPDEIIVVHDDNRKEIDDIAKKYGVASYVFKERGGKRIALVKGWELAKNDIVVQLDSDEILERNAIEEIVKPFEDSMVVAVQGKNLVYDTGSKFANQLSTVVEYNRDWNCKALNGNLVVADGRFNAWRKEFLLKHKDGFLNDKWFGENSVIGDDRWLTQTANAEGYKTVYQNTAVAATASPESYLKYIKQQLRWMRSGYKFLYTDFKKKLPSKTRWLYTYLQVAYYLGPFSFAVALIHDGLFSPPISNASWPLIIAISVLGSSLIVLLRRCAVGYFKVSTFDLFRLGFSALFIEYPTSIYALLTVKKQENWGTR